MSTILIIEDPNHVDLLSKLTACLERRGHKVTGVYWNNNHTGLIGKLRAYAFIIRNNPDVLFIHFGTCLPLKDARGVIRRVKRNKPHIRIVVITNIEPDGTFGEVSTLRKPILTEDLLDLAKP